MEGITEFLRAFPAAWMVVGAGIIGVIFYVVNRRVLSLSRESQEALVAGYKERLSLLQVERDEYRNNLHAERNAHNNTKIRQAELESRPDLTAVFKAYQDEADKRFAVYGQQTSLIGGIAQSIERTATMMERLDNQITEHDKQVEDRLSKHFIPVTTAINATAEAMQTLVAQLQKVPVKKRRILEPNGKSN